jgi:hypothetical protein
MANLKKLYIMLNINNTNYKFYSRLILIKEFLKKNYIDYYNSFKRNHIFEFHFIE